MPDLYVGTAVPVRANVKTRALVAYDAANVLFHYTDPAGTDYLKTFGTDEEVQKIEDGIYELTVYTPFDNDFAGKWTVTLHLLDSSNRSLLTIPTSFKLKTLQAIPD